MLLKTHYRSLVACSVAGFILSACSGDGNVTTLDARPTVSIGLPQILLDSQAVDENLLRPAVVLSNGATVSMQRGAGNTWSGTINVAPASEYVATVTWLENIDGRELPLARLEQSLEVAADGTVVRSEASGYSTDIDNDSGGKSNLEERENGTDPFQNANDDDPSNPPDDGGNENPITPDPAPDPISDPNTTPDPTPNPIPDPTPNPIPDPTPNPIPDPTPNPAPDPTPNPVPDPTPTPDPAPDPVPAVADVIIPRVAVSAVPVIDGKNVTIGSDGNFDGEWAAAVKTDNSGATLFIDNLIIDVDSEGADGLPYRRWAAMHDGTYLYVVVMVDDNGDRQRDSAADIAQDDSLELFIDGDNSKSSRYGADDFHRLFPVQLAGADKQSASAGDVAGPNSSTAALAVDFATGPGIGPRGIRRPRFEQDVYELRIDLASAGIDVDAAFGFDLQVNDDDGGEDRESKWAWFLPSRTSTDVDGTVSNPSLMGTAVLE